MSTSSKNNTTTLDLDLKTQGKRSHNEAHRDAHIKALVEQMARQAAEDDFKMYQDALRSQDK